MARVPTNAEHGGGVAAPALSGVHSLPDECLIDWFLRRDEAEAQLAFGALVRRHGPMVLGVCRHILGQAQDAEDAFQATFLVLARRAGTIRDRRVLGRWLYEVAYRVALRSKGLAARRRAHERQGVEMTAFEPAGDPGRVNDPAWNELRPVLHEEINRLPEKYRDAVVLCYLEGHTNEEAAELLDWPVGTVKGRLFRARELLRSRLTRRGLVLSAALLSLRFSRNTVFAEVVPSRLTEATALAAVRSTRGSAPVPLSNRVALLVEEGLRTPRAVDAVARALAARSLVLLVAAALLGGALTLLMRTIASSYEGPAGPALVPGPRQLPGDSRPLIGPAFTPDASCEPGQSPLAR